MLIQPDKGPSILISIAIFFLRTGICNNQLTLLMARERTIVFACDDVISLSQVLSCLQQSASIAYNIITAARVHDAINIVSAVTADLAILCFRNNQLALRDFSAVANKKSLPLLCLTRRDESDDISWNNDCIVFTCTLAQARNGGYLAARVNSIFLLRGGEAPVQSTRQAPKPMLKTPADDNTTNLSRYVLELDKKTEVLSKVKDRIAGLYPHVDNPVKAELHSILNAIKLSINDNRLWEDFKLLFEQTDPNFLYALAQKYPSLTPIDIKYCCYLKMNMSNDDIRKLLGINQESVRVHKYRLKKKMSLSKDDDLRGHLRAVG